MEPPHRRCGAKHASSRRPLDDDRLHPVPAWLVKTRARQQPVGAPGCPSLAPPTGGNGRNQQRGELVDENKVATGTQHACALAQSGVLIRPVVKRRAADHQVDRGIGMGEVLSDADGKGQSVVFGAGSGRVNHVGGGVNSGQLRRLGVLAGQSPQQVAVSASHVEDTLRSGNGGGGQRGGAVADGVMPAGAPAPVVAGCTIVVRTEIAIRRHARDSRIAYPLT